MFTYVGIVIVVVQGGLVGRLAARFGEATTAPARAPAMAAGRVGLPFSPGQAAAVVVVGILAAGQGLASPTLSTLLSRESRADEQGGILGIGQSLAAAARAIGPLLAGWLYDVSVALPYVLGAILGLAAAALVSRIAVADEPRASAERVLGTG
jgi:DHA1 family tetracycline resistance protein-like MFS transporter